MINGSSRKVVLTDRKRTEGQREGKRDTTEEREWGWSRKGDETSPPPSPMATEWAEGRGCPSGPVNQQFTAESCSANHGTGNPWRSIFQHLAFLFLFFFSRGSHHSLFPSVPQSCTTQPHLTLQESSLSPKHVYYMFKFTSRWAIQACHWSLKDQFRKKNNISHSSVLCLSSSHGNR